MLILIGYKTFSFKTTNREHYHLTGEVKKQLWSLYMLHIFWIPLIPLWIQKSKYEEIEGKIQERPLETRKGDIWISLGRSLFLRALLLVVFFPGIGMLLLYLIQR